VNRGHSLTACRGGGILKGYKQYWYFKILGPKNWEVHDHNCA